MDSKLEEYLKQKYADQLGQLNTAQAFANLGDVFGGKTVGSQNPYYKGQQDLAKQQTLDEIKAQEDRDLKAQYYAQSLAQKQLELEQKKAQEEANRDLKKMAIEQSSARAREAKELKEATLAQGKQLPVAPIESSANADASILALDEAAKSFEQNKDIAGPQQAYLTKAEKYLELGDAGKRAKSFDAQLKINAQVIGKYLESGKLTDADIDRYKEMLPNLNDSYEVALAKTQNLKNIIARKQAIDLSSLKAAGYNIGSLKASNPNENTPTPKQSEPIRKNYKGITYELKPGSDSSKKENWFIVGGK